MCCCRPSWQLKFRRVPWDFQPLRHSISCWFWTSTELCQTDFAANLLWTPFGHSCMNPANIIDLKLPQSIAALKDSNLLGKSGEKTESHIKLTTNREMSKRTTRHTLCPIPGFHVTGGELTRATELLFAYLFPLFFLCALGTPVVCKDPNRTSGLQTAKKISLGFRLTS